MKKVLVLLMVVCGVAALASADIISLTTTGDAMITDYTPDGNISTSYNSIGVVNEGSQRRTVVRFDTSSMSTILSNPNTTINSVTMKLTGGPATFTGAAVVLSIATKNAGWVESQVTWNSRSTGTSWAGNSPGSESTNVGSFSWSNGDSGVEYSTTFSGTSAELSGLLSSWTSSSNAGLLILSTGTTTNQILGLVSKEHATATAPTLVVDYTVVPEPATMGLLVVGGLFGIVRRRRKS